MPTLLIAAASALLLAAVVTEATQRFFPNSYFALLVITFIALLINGLFNARLRQTPAAADGNQRRDQADNRAGNQSKQRSEKPKERGEQPRNRDRSKARQDSDGKPATSKPAAASKAPDGPTETGTVKWFNRSKGYGFIVRDNGEEIFVHQRSIVREGDSRQRPVLRDGQKVSYVVSHQEKGAQAEHVQGFD